MREISVDEVCFVSGGSFISSTANIAIGVGSAAILGVMIAGAAPAIALAAGAVLAGEAGALGAGAALALEGAGAAIGLSSGAATAGAGLVAGGGVLAGVDEGVHLVSD